jgi:DNA polymerase III gamma/tau subunit
MVTVLSRSQVSVLSILDAHSMSNGLTEISLQKNITIMTNIEAIIPS